GANVPEEVPAEEGRGGGPAGEAVERGQEGSRDPAQEAESPRPSVDLHCKNRRCGAALGRDYGGCLKVGDAVFRKKVVLECWNCGWLHRWAPRTGPGA